MPQFFVKKAYYVIKVAFKLSNDIIDEIFLPYGKKIRD